MELNIVYFLIAILVITGLLGISGLFWLKASLARERRELQEYKELFNESDSVYKKSQSDIRELLNKLSDRDILLERSSQAFSDMSSKLTLNQSTLLEKDEEIQSLKSALQFQQEQYDKLLGQKKSSEVRTGKITEQISPFLKEYPYDPKEARFLGDPIDLVSFGQDKVTFIEIKSGNSQLNKRQRQIRDLIKAGKVEFYIYRIKGD